MLRHSRYVVWAGDNSVTVTIVDESGSTVDGITITAKLADEPTVKVTGVSSGGKVFFMGVPSRTIVIEGKTADNKVAWPFS